MVARVMQNFDLTELILVLPRKRWPNKKSLDSAKSAKNIIKKVKVYNSLELALSKFNYVVATTNRKRFLEKKILNSFSNLNKSIISNKKTAIIFGPENSGLANEDLRLSDCLFTINTSSKNNSLNLSHAVSIFSYKFYESFSKNINKLDNHRKLNKLSTKGELSHFTNYLISQLDKVNFFYPSSKRHSMIDNIYAIFLKASLSKKEVNTLWGMIKKLRK